MAHLVAGDWGRYGRVRLWGSAGFMLTVFLAGAWFDRFGMGHFPGWTAITLLAVLRDPAVRWFLASLFFHVMAHFSIYGFLSLYLDSLGYDKVMIGVLWAV